MDEPPTGTVDSWPGLSLVEDDDVDMMVYIDNWQTGLVAVRAIDDGCALGSIGKLAENYYRIAAFEWRCTNKDTMGNNNGHYAVLVDHFFFHLTSSLPHAHCEFRIGMNSYFAP